MATKEELNAEKKHLRKCIKEMLKINEHPPAGYSHSKFYMILTDCRLRIAEIVKQLVEMKKG